MSEIELPRHEEDVKKYLETLNTSQLMMEVMDPWGIGIASSHGDIIRKQLEERRHENLENVQRIGGMLMGNHCASKEEEKFANYHAFRKRMIDRIGKTAYNLDADLSHYKRLLDDEQARMKNEKTPYLSGENLNLKLCVPAKENMMIFTGLKMTDRGVRKVAKRVAHYKSAPAEGLEDPKAIRDYVRNVASINDWAKIRLVLMGDESRRERQMGRANIVMRQLDQPHLEYKEKPYPHHKVDIRNTLLEYSPQDPVSFQVLGIYSFLDDLFGETCHPIYEQRFANKMYLPGGRIYELTKDEIRIYNTLAEKALGFMAGQSSA
ncbi:MAG: hypothetical protein V1648_00840 [Candidatus Aenigmatarchaeota archaeon]